MADEKTRPLLDEATWEEIADELHSRFDAVLLAVVKDPGTNQEFMRYRVHGGTALGVGLARWVEVELVKGATRS